MNKRQEWTLDKRRTTLEQMEQPLLKLLELMRQEGFMRGHREDAEGVLPPHVQTSAREMLKEVYDALGDVERRRALLEPEAQE